jgi:hypothetical protein
MYLSLRIGVAVGAVAVAAVVMPRTASAQQGNKRQAATTVEIRGEVPTPQVVTVRPRQIPAYSRGILVPALYDRHFWAAILEPYRIVPPLPSDTAHRPPMVAGDTTHTSAAPPAAPTPAAPNALPRERN